MGCVGKCTQVLIKLAVHTNTWCFSQPCNLSPITISFFHISFFANRERKKYTRKVMCSDIIFHFMMDLISEEKMLVRLLMLLIDFCFFPDLLDILKPPGKHIYPYFCYLWTKVQWMYSVAQCRKSRREDEEERGHQTHPSYREVNHCWIVGKPFCFTPQPLLAHTSAFALKKPSNKISLWNCLPQNDKVKIYLSPFFKK